MADTPQLSSPHAMIDALQAQLNEQTAQTVYWRSQALDREDQITQLLGALAELAPAASAAEGESAMSNVAAPGSPRVARKRK